MSTAPAEGFLPLMTQPVGAAKPYLFASHTPDQQFAELVDLDAWVGWLIARYRLDARTIPPCWALHGELIEELSALRTAWSTAYATMANGDAPLAWHERFATARSRLQDWVARTGCRADEHR